MTTPASTTPWLTGWQQIADYVGCHPKTAMRSPALRRAVSRALGRRPRLHRDIADAIIAKGAGKAPR